MVSDEEAKLPLILVADDDEMIHQIIVSMMSGYARVYSVCNTKEVEIAMRDLKPDLVLLDDIMPGGMTGLQFLSYVSDDEELKKTPIIMVTASNKPAEVLRGLSAGAADYITKPFKPDVLMHAVQKQLEHHTPRICIVTDDTDLEYDLHEALTRLKCDVDNILPEAFDLSMIAESGYDLALLICAEARSIAEAVHNQKRQNIYPKLYVVSLVEDDVLDDEKDRMYYIPSSVPVLEILKKVGELLKPSQN